MDVTLTLIETILTDGSSTYDLRIGGNLTLPCVTLRDANWLIAKLGDAIEAHTNACCSEEFDLVDPDDGDVSEARWLARMSGTLEA